MTAYEKDTMVIIRNNREQSKKNKRKRKGINNKNRKRNSKECQGPSTYLLRWRERGIPRKEVIVIMAHISATNRHQS